MSLTKDNVLPGSNGMLFGTNAKSEKSVMEVKKAILSVSGVTEVEVNMDEFPRQLTVYTDTIVKLDEIEQAVVAIGFHAIRDHKFGL